MRILYVLVLIAATFLNNVSSATTTSKLQHTSKVNSTKLSNSISDSRGKRTLNNIGDGFTYQNYYDRNFGQGYSTSRSYNPYDGTSYNTAISGSPHYSSNYLAPTHNHPHFAYHPYIEPPEPIIEIIIKDSNDTFAHPPQPIIHKKKKEKVHVFYVKYKKGEDNKLHLDEPIASINNDDDQVHPGEEDVIEYPVVTPLPLVKATTLRTVIHPDSEKFHSNNKHVHVTFGSENNLKIGHRIEEHNAESVRQSVVAVPVKYFQKHQRNYIDSQRYQQLPQIRSRSSYQTPTGPSSRPNQEHYQQLPHQQSFINFKPSYQQQPQNQFNQQNYQNQNQQQQQQFNTKPFFGSSLYQHQKEPQKQSLSTPPPPPNTQLLPLQYNGQQQQTFFRPNQYQPQQQEQNHKPQPIPLNTEILPPKPPQQHFVPPSPPLQPQYNQIQQQQHHQSQQQSIHVQAHSQQSQPQNHNTQPQYQSQPQSQQRPNPPQAVIQQNPIPQQQQSHVQHQSHFQEQSHVPQQSFNYQNNRFQNYQPNYQVNKPLSVLPIQKESSASQFNQHPGSDVLTSIQSKFSIQPSKQTELLKSIPKYEQHITETVNITPNYENTHSQTFNGNYSRPQGHLITASSIQSNKEVTNYVTTPRSAYMPQPSSQTPRYVHSQNGEQVQIVTPMPSTSIYNLEQQQRLLSHGKQPVIIPNSQPKPSYPSPYSVSTLYSDAFQELEQKKQQYSAKLKDTYANVQHNQPSASALSSSSAPLRPEVELPDEIPDDLRQQLLSSGILNNADISVLDYDKVGDIALENLPQEHLQHFYGAGGAAQISESNNVLTIVKPNGDAVNITEKEIETIKETGVIPKKDVELKVVRFDSENKKAVTKYVKDDATILPTVDLSSEKTYNKYLPVKVNGAQFPIPDVEELRGKSISNVVVLAPVDTLQSSENDERQERDTSKGVKFNESGDNLKVLVKKPTRGNFKKWLESELSQDVEQQSVVLLVSRNSSNDQEIYLYDISNGSVNKLSGELSSTFVSVAEENASSENLENASPYNGDIMEEKKVEEKSKK